MRKEALQSKRCHVFIKYIHEGALCFHIFQVQASYAPLKRAHATCLSPEPQKSFF